MAVPPLPPSTRTEEHRAAREWRPWACRSAPLGAMGRYPPRCPRSQRVRKEFGPQKIRARGLCGPAHLLEELGSGQSARAALYWHTRTAAAILSTSSARALSGGKLGDGEPVPPQLRSDALDSLERFVQTAIKQLQEGEGEHRPRAVFYDVVGILSAFPSWRRPGRPSPSPILPPQRNEEVAEWIDRTYGWTGSRGYKGAARRPIL